MRFRWTLSCALGEALGIALVALAYAAADRGLVAPAPAVLAGGAWEGLCLGLAQALALRTRGVAGPAWVLATMLAATLGYGLSLIGGAGPEAAGAVGSEPAFALILAAAAGLGVAMGALMGAVQWSVARTHFALRSWLWRNAAGWALAMPFIFAGSALVGPGWSFAALGLTGAASGALAGAALGRVTAAALPAAPSPR